MNTSWKQLGKRVLGNYPLLKLFNFDEEQVLVYDAKPNFMFLLDKKDLDALYIFLQDEESGAIDTELQKRFRGLRSLGVLNAGSVDKLGATQSNEVQKQLDYYWENILMRKFVIEITERCNFRCRYCPNSIETVYRHHTSKQMSIETARRSIDFYMQMYVKFYQRLSPEKKELLLQHYPPCLGIYGGEPTLNWSTVVNATEYYKSLNWEEAGIPIEKLVVTINTNLSNMNDDILEFLVKHNVLLFTSLDGPKEENDKNRVDVNGKGTFDVTFSNLMKIKNYNLHYFKNRVSVFAVRANNYDEEKVNAFLDNIGCVVSYLGENVYGCFVRNPQEIIANMERNEPIWLNDKVNTILRLEKEDEDKCFSEMDGLYVLDSILTEAPRDNRRMNLFLSCPMGIDNIMVGANGDFHICHKTDGSMPFGNIYTGVDMKKLLDLYEKYINRTNCKECCSCWAVHFCKCCGATRMRGGDFVNPTVSECDVFRKDAEWTIKLFIEIYKRSPELITKLMERKHDLEYYKSIVDFNEFSKK